MVMNEFASYGACKDFGKKLAAAMSDKKQIPPQYDLNAKWDACLDPSLCRFAYSSLAGAFGGLLLFRSPATRWASVAFGAGIGLESAFTECSQKFNTSPVALALADLKTTETAADLKPTDTSASQVEQE